MTKIDTSTKAVEALLKGVTEGPWGYGKTGEEQRLILGAGGRGNYIANVTIHQIPRHMGLWEEDERESNAQFIAASRELVPALLAERNQLRDELEAKLAKAVEALAGVDKFVRYLSPFADPSHCPAPALAKACEVHAELTGESHE